MRRGIISAGTWLVDQLKFIEKFPAVGNLTTILREEVCLGGCAHNVLGDLAMLGSGLPLYAGGLVGNDENGDLIMSRISGYGIDTTYMNRTEDAATSYTLVMIPSDGSSRTFFHCRGANALLGVDQIERMDSPAKIFHLGYLLLLDELDAEDPQYGIRAARVLDMLQKKGYLTSVDVVSEEGDRFRKIVLPCLPYIDYLVINEVEAGACFGQELRDGEGRIMTDKVAAAAEFMLGKGVGKSCVIHFPEGGYRADAGGKGHYEPSLRVSSSEIISPVGAGDAFCAGMLYALHEEMPPRDSLIFANTSARFNLTHATSCGGAPTLAQINEFINQNYK